MQVRFSNGDILHIDISRKHVKNITLRVHPDGVVRISAPFGVPEASIRRFVEKKSRWLEKHVQHAKSRAEGMPKEGIIRLLGENYTLRLELGGKDNVSIVGEEMIIRSANGNHEAVLDQWWRETAQAYYVRRADKWLERLGGLIQQPAIRVRKMKSMWGSCTCHKAEIRFNYYLLCAPPECVDYVVLHELAHLLYPNHGDLFKAFLAKWMPDWKERKKKLGWETRHMAN